MVTVHDSAPAPTSVISSVFGARWPPSTSPTAAPVTSAMSPCDQLQKAIGNDSRADIIASMQLIAEDKTVNDTAREDARYYLGHPNASESVQESVKFYCNFNF